ncbi:hypothetical protein B0H14DRAFT_2240059, partial [Mycena olivaceomarginata]
GNVAQSLVWEVNEMTYRQTLETEGGPPAAQTSLKMYYGSIHDAVSYPCELVQAASVSICGPQGQYIENVHLQTFTSCLGINQIFVQE